MQSSVNKVLNEFGERVTILAKINLGILKKDSSKKLRQSIKHEVKVYKNSFEFSILMEDYGEWVDKGRKAGKGAPVGDIEKWIRTKPVRLRDISGKFIRKTDKSIKQATFLINRKIKEEGIEPTNFLRDPMETELKKLPDDLINAYDLDIDVMLKHSLNKMNIDYK